MFRNSVNVVCALIVWLGSTTGSSAQSQEALDAFSGADYSRAARLLEREMSEGRPANRIPLFLGVCYLNLGRTEKALPLLLDASDRFPEDAEVWFNLGLCSFRLRKFDEAADALEKSLSINPGQPQVYKLLGRIHVVREAYSRAERGRSHLVH